MLAADQQLPFYTWLGIGLVSVGSVSYLVMSKSGTSASVPEKKEKKKKSS